MPEIMLSDVVESLLPHISEKLKLSAGSSISGQLQSIIIPLQKIGGEPDNFSVMVFPHPRPTPDELKMLPFVGEASYTVEADGVQLEFDVDQFGKINWLHVKGAPEIFRDLSAALSRIAAGQGGKPFWEY